MTRWSIHRTLCKMRVKKPHFALPDVKTFSHILKVDEKEADELNEFFANP